MRYGEEFISLRREVWIKCRNCWVRKRRLWRLSRRSWRCWAKAMASVERLGVPGATSEDAEMVAELSRLQEEAAMEVLKTEETWEGTKLLN